MQDICKYLTHQSAAWVAIIILALSICYYPIFNPAADASQTGLKSLHPKVLVLLFNPIIESQGSQRLVDLKGWSDPTDLDQQFKDAIFDSSAGLVDYHIIDLVEIDGYPAKDNGHVFTDEEYLDCVATGGSGSNCSLLINYQKLLEEYDICNLVNKGSISELWLWGGPWFGYYEAIQAGRHPISTNAPPLTGTDCKKTLDIMGFSYERGVTEMLEDFAHRVEGNMDHIYGARAQDESTPWNRFTLLDRDVPGRGGCGDAHNAVNAAVGINYDRDNTRTVPSSCDDFLNYPDLTGTFTQINCNAWGCTAAGYLEWWLNHLPRSDGKTDGKLNNWWLYVVRR